MSKQAKKERAAFRNMARTADHYGVDVSTIERWIDERGFPRPIRAGRFRLFKITETDAWDEAQRECAA